MYYIIYKFEKKPLPVGHQQHGYLATHIHRIQQETKDHTLRSWRVYGDENIVVTLKFSSHIGIVHNNNIQYGFSNMNIGVHSKQLF